MKIAKLLILRFYVVKQISNYKQSNKVKIEDKKREWEVINNVKKHSKQYKIFITKIFETIIDCSKKIQR